MTNATQQDNLPSPKGTESRFRQRRGRLLSAMIRDLAAAQGRPLRILDVGGRADYWKNVGLDNIEKIVVINNDKAELQAENEDGITPVRFEYVKGDACNLDMISDLSFDLAHSNSVIEHVGAWENMAAMAGELQRVGPAGWVQTPAWEFPGEPHFRVAFMHWFASPIRRRMLRLSRNYRAHHPSSRRYHVDRINLLSRKEVSMPFPGRDVYTERVMLAPKSYVVYWGAVNTVGRRKSGKRTFIRSTAKGGVR